MSSKKSLLAGAFLAAGTLLLSACGGSDGGSAASSGSSAGDSGSGELTQITLATNPSAQSAPLFLGIQDGIYAKHGLEVEVVPQTDVAAIISGVASGQYDFGFATVVHVINANLNDIPIRAVGTVEGQQKPAEDPEEGNALVAGPDSGITSAADLGGKTLGVIGLSSLNTLAAWDMAANAGVDPTSINLIQLPFGQMPAALAAGDIDAAVVQAPFIAEAVTSGATIIGKPNVETFPDMAVGLYTTSQSYIDGNEAIVKAFAEATVEAQEYATANVDKAKATLVENLGITEEAAQAAKWNTGSNPYVNVEGFATAQELLMKYAGQTDELDVNELVWPGALEGGDQ
ncbi:ABC transporter substrate-binding protein [Nakamurella leprariae]|uniref:ABC transporter substrate-binding protein n=1 Tax=Nakamurella leprariae TaxID=2803911 RepID=A0A939BX26_9ACTN|nr:ABC transporter substrate-binding protein [Nakamurella leprariae]MBM9468128.1 ABC transporter substrate-binding protein [Nakamurella leprariae]